MTDIKKNREADKLDGKTVQMCKQNEKDGCGKWLYLYETSCFFKLF
jgi:hypothetical protein